MAVDSSFASLFQNLKVDDPWLPSKPWESISSESGVSSSSSQPTCDPLYDPSIVSEINLVRLAINALQGVESTLRSIENLSESFCNEPADRTSNRIPSLWYRTSSTTALGKILKSIGRTGFVVFLLHKLVDYFLHTSLNTGEINKDEETKRKQGDAELRGSQTNYENETGTHNGCSLVNQAFAVAVKKVLEGFVCSLDTLHASVQLRRSPNNVDTSTHVSSGVGCLTSVMHSEITFLEVYLHTRDLRTQIESVGNICSLKNVPLAFSTSSLENLTAEATIGFCNFPRGANLLSYLYSQLRDADPVHHKLIEFLFIRSCEPYCGFIKSWIYQAKISDPHKEFIVEYVDESPDSHGGTDFSNGIWLSSIKLRDGVSVPCFMECFCLPLLRAGQQLQVLIKLLELCHCVRPGDQTYEDILPCWISSFGAYPSNLLPLTFNKSKIEEMVSKRENMYRTMREKLQVFFTRLDINYQTIGCKVMPFGTVPTNGAVQVPFPFTLDDNLTIPSTADEGNSNSEAETHDSDNSWEIDGISYGEVAFASSECSSCNSSGEENESDEPTERRGNSVGELRCLSASGLSTKFPNGNLSPKTLYSKKLHAMECVRDKTFERMKSTSHSGYPHEESKLNDISDCFQSQDTTYSRFSETVDTDFQSVNCWPLGGLSENPFYDNEGRSRETQLHLVRSRAKGPGTSNGVLNVELPFSTEVYVSDDSMPPQQARGGNKLVDKTHAPSDLFLSPSWNLKYKSNVFNMNPMLTKNTWGHMINKSSGRSHVGYKQHSTLYYAFSSIEDPRKVYGERLLGRPDDGFQDERRSFLDSALPATRGVDEHFEEQGLNLNDTAFDQINSSSVMFDNQQEEKCSTCASGGAKWESTLRYLSKRIPRSAGAHRESSGAALNMPLDVIIDKCILQEILLQYTYVSNFTIKLLEDGFDLRGHLLALRRYHFMEFADWADLFIMSLWHHKWSVAEASQRISEIQGLLDLAVQRSSCEGDPYKERLFVYMKVDGRVPLLTAGTGVHAFDFVALGYRVDWPISIIITLSALKIYADIFSFLIQVKLAIFSLTDVWRSLKDLVHLLGQNHISELNERDTTYFNIITRMRHQVNHFVSTLQQYVQSQLSHVSWCRFLHSLKHQVKDMLDLKSVHMAYLADSLHICFLSDETRAVAGIIESILQCALDFRSCIVGCCWEIGLDQRNLSNLFARLNFPQVLAIKTTFERNLKELYICYLKSPKHEESGICRLWEYLNYNEYYSSVTGTGVVQNAF